MESIVEICQFISENSGLIIELVTLVLAIAARVSSKKAHESIVDYKREIYKNGMLPDRGKKNHRY